MDLTLYPYDRANEYEQYSHTANVLCQANVTSVNNANSTISDFAYRHDLKLCNTSKCKMQVVILHFTLLNSVHL